MKRTLLELLRWTLFAFIISLPICTYLDVRHERNLEAIAQTPTPSPTPTNRSTSYSTKAGKRTSFHFEGTNSDGDACLNVEGLIYKSVNVVLNSGTATWNIVFSNDNGTSYADLWNGESSSESYEFMTEASQACITVSACGSCDIDASIRAGNEYSVR